MSVLAMTSMHEPATSRKHASYSTKPRTAKMNTAVPLQQKAACTCGGNCPHCASENQPNVARPRDFAATNNRLKSQLSDNKVYAADSPVPDNVAEKGTVLQGGNTLQATTAATPTMTSGLISITETPLSVVQQGGAILANTMGFVITKPFSVSASAQIQEPADSEPFEYGLVQNLFFDHIEEVFTEGDMLIDNVGPMVDVDTSNPSERPFIHANARMPSTLFTTTRVGPSFDDRPSLEVMLNKLHCEKQKNVQLKMVKRSAQFRVGLVARGLKSQRLIPLGAIEKTYGFSWQVDFVGPAFKSTDAANLTGSYTLSSSASMPIMDGTIAGAQAQTLLNAEGADFEQRCGNVL